MAYDVIDVRPQRHLGVRAGRQVSARSIRIQGMRQQADPRLAPDPEILTGQGLDQFEDGGHFGQVHCIAGAGGAVEHHLCNVVRNPKVPGIVRRQVCAHNEDDIRRVAHSPVMWLIEFHRDLTLAVPLHQFLVLTNRAFQVPGAAAVHLVEPEQGDCAPGVVNGFGKYFGIPDEVVRAGICTQERKVAVSTGCIERAVVLR